MSQFQIEKNTPATPLNEDITVGSEHETPMPSGQMFAYQLRASALIFIFYVYSAIAIILGAFAALFFAIAAARVPYSWSMAVVIFAILKIFCKSLRLGKGADFNIKLTQEEAPQFFSDVELLSQKLAVAPPREIVIESGPNAYVQLSGFFTGSGKTKLGFGFDFLAGLNKNQARSVLAHEMAHAKHVKRGYQGFLMRGLLRLTNCEASLQAVANYSDNSALAKGIAKAFVFVPKNVVKRAARLIAACSRYDEFLADRVAAQLIGPQIMKEALLATYVIDHQGAKLHWRERLLHIDRSPGYTAWLEQQFHVPDDEKRLEIEGRAIERAERNELSTHPALPDRLKALDDFQGELDLVFENDETVAATWLKNPDVTAKRLLGEVERVAAKEEAKATQELAKGMRKSSVGKTKTLQCEVLMGIGMILFSLVVIGFLWIDNPWTDVPIKIVSTFGISIVLGLGVEMIRGASLKVKIGDLPVPTFANYRAAQLRIYQEGRKVTERKDLPGRLDNVMEREAKNSRWGAEIRSQIPAAAKKDKVRFLAALAATMPSLEACEYEKALVGSRIAFDLDSKDKNTDAMCIYIVAMAALHNADFSGYISTLREKSNGWNVNWAAAWMACLNGETETGEALLIELARQKPKVACLWALLGYCQANNGKPRESINSRRRALELSQQTGDVDDEACHRFVLAQNLIALGQLTEAGSHIDWLKDYAKRESMLGLEQFSLDLELLRYQMAMGEEEQALQFAAQIRDSQDEAPKWIRLGYVLNESREAVFLNAAQNCFESALGMGFYPEALSALATIEFERENKAVARTMFLKSLNCLQKRPVGAAHPVSLLSNVLGNIRSIDDVKPTTVSGHEVHLDITKIALEVENLGVDKISLLCFAPTLDDAKARALEIFNALLPNKELTEHLTSNPAPENYQPKEPMPGGIYSCKWE